eukprot:TRINITY_DN8100_c0_g1_i2.p1 TRINITY_DN8100_c0_g1~~TRINITY_DN8100_c0_g1_i2.p1  ORF type:complete len:1463 (+),score=340.59 TRINITY_DN8100_c0_g1_i2:80-4390(+)
MAASEPAPLAPNTAVFYQDSEAGWAVGVVLGYDSEAGLVVRDPQRGADAALPAEAVAGGSVVPVPRPYSLLDEADFIRLAALSHLPQPLPADAWEPAVLHTLLQRMARGRWETLVAAPPAAAPLLVTFPAVDDAAGSEPPFAQLCSTLAERAARGGDSACILPWGGTGRSVPSPGLVAARVARGVASRLAARTPAGAGAGRAAGALALLEALLTRSAPRRPCVGMGTAAVQLRVAPGGRLLGACCMVATVDPAAVAATFATPSPDGGPPEPEFSAPLCLALLARSPHLRELQLPPSDVLLALMPPEHFRHDAPSYAEAAAAIDLCGNLSSSGPLQHAGPGGRGLWTVLGAVLHLLLGRLVLLLRGAPPPRGVHSCAEHVARAAQCLQLPRGDLLLWLQHSAAPPGAAADAAPGFALSPAGLAALAAHLYERVARAVLAPPPREEGEGRLLLLCPCPPAEPPWRGARAGMGRYGDAGYTAAAVEGFIAQHCPQQRGRGRELVAEYLSGAADGAGSERHLQELLCNLESKHGRQGWFAARARLCGIYERARPELLPSADDVLTRYQGREAELFDALLAKYGPAGPQGPTLENQLAALFGVRDPARVAEAPALAQQAALGGDPGGAQLTAELEAQYPGAGMWLAARAECWRIYAAHCPGRLQHVDAVLCSDRFRGREGDLVESLERKYGPAEAPAAPPDPDCAAPAAWCDAARLVDHSVQEVLQLLYLHHFHPDHPSVPQRQALVDALLSPCGESLLGHCLDRAHPSEAAGAAVAVLGRAGMVYGTGSLLTVEHTERPVTYDTTFLDLNTDPIAAADGEGRLRRSAAPLVRALATSPGAPAAHSWLARSMQGLAGLLEEIGRSESPPVWALLCDANSRPDRPEVDVSWLLRQLRRFHIAPIAAAAAAASEAQPPPPELPAEGAPAEEQAAGEEDSDTDGGAAAPLAAHSGDAVLWPVASGIHDAAEATVPAAAQLPGVCAVTQLAQREWTGRCEVAMEQGAAQRLLWCEAAEGLRRERRAEGEQRSRAALRLALQLRCVYLDYAAGLLGVEGAECSHRQWISERRAEALQACQQQQALAARLSAERLGGSCDHSPPRRPDGHLAVPPGSSGAGSPPRPSAAPAPWRGAGAARAAPGGPRSQTADGAALAGFAALLDDDGHRRSAPRRPSPSPVRSPPARGPPRSPSPPPRWVAAVAAAPPPTSGADRAASARAQLRQQQLQLQASVLAAMRAASPQRCADEPPQPREVSPPRRPPRRSPLGPPRPAADRAGQKGSSSRRHSAAAAAAAAAALGLSPAQLRSLADLCERGMRQQPPASGRRLRRARGAQPHAGGRPSPSACRASAPPRGGPPLRPGRTSRPRDAPAAAAVLPPPPRRSPGASAAAAPRAASAAAAPRAASAAAAPRAATPRALRGRATPPPRATRARTLPDAAGCRRGPT